MKTAVRAGLLLLAITVAAAWLSGECTAADEDGLPLGRMNSCGASFCPELAVWPRSAEVITPYICRLGPARELPEAAAAQLLHQVTLEKDASVPLGLRQRWRRADAGGDRHHHQSQGGQL